MHDLRLVHQDALRPEDLAHYADQLDLETERFRNRLREHADAAGTAEDVDPATSPACPARRRCSSTAAACAAPTTSPH
jgi:hypothetical protein